MNAQTPPSRPGLQSRLGWIDRFLGDAAAEGGPFALLGLPHDIAGPAPIGEAVRRRLQAIDAHPLRLTPEADEVRLAIHTAAAQLADPALRAELAKHFPPGKPAAVPRAWRTHLRTLTPQLRARARHVIGASGGWNSKAKTRLAMIARQHRVSAMDLVRDITPRPQASDRARAIAKPRPLPPIPWPVPTGRLWMTVHALLFLLLVVISVMTAVEMTRPAPDPAPDPVRPQQVDTGTDPSLATPPVRSEFAHFSAMEQELANAARTLDASPRDATSRAARVLATFLNGWTQIPPDARARLVAGIAAFGPAVLTEDAGDQPDRRAMAGIVADLARAAAATGEPAPIDPAWLDARLLSTLADMADAADTLAPAWWESWARAVRACAAVPQPDRDTAVLDAATGLLQRDAPGRDGMIPIARVLAASVPWRAGDPSRVWLLQRLADPDTDADALAGFVRVLATEVSVPGISPADALPSEPTMARRDRLAQTLRAAWSDLRPPLTPLESELIESLRAALDAEPDPSDPLSMLRAIEDLVRVNAGAALAHRGEEEPAAALLADVFVPLAPRDAESSPPTGSDLGVRLLNTENDEEAAALLREIARNPLSPSNADALVETASRGRSREVRELARGIILSGRPDPQVMLALERRVSARTPGLVVSLAEQLLGVNFPPDDPDRARALRAALLIRAAELSPGAPPDLRYLELKIQEHLAARAGLASGEPAPVSVAALVESLAESLASSGDAPPPVSGATVTGAAPAFAARQRELAVLLARSMSAESALWTPLVEPVIRRLEEAWRDATTASAQVLAAQRAEARLWLIRLEGLP